MKKSIKLCSLFLLFLLTSALCIIGLTGCGGSEVEQIYINTSNSPRLNYVKGQELDLSGGKLTAVIGGEETLIPLTAEGVTVSGYDATKLGSQTVSVSYEGQTTSFTVTVIERIVAESYEKGYFINDSFKADKGRLRIAKDDASVFTVNLNDSRVTISAFDSSTEGEKTITATFSDGTNTYSCNFNVTVYGASNVSIVYPSKTSYYTHEKHLDFSGGYLTVKAGEGGSITRHINISEDMTSGYNPDVVTIENRDNPVSQEISITYLGYTFKYKVSVRYSGVSIINDMMETLGGVNLDGEEIVLTEAEKAAALDAISEYYKLSTKLKALISEEDLNVIARCATVAVNELYIAEFEKISNTLVIDTKKGQIGLSAKSYLDAVNDVAVLEDKTALLNVYAEILRNMKEQFTELILTGEKTVAGSITVVEKSANDNIVSMLKHIITLYETLSVVPTEWTVEGLSEYAEAIEEVYKSLSREKFYSGGSGSIYNALSKWRENNDFFEIVYSYYLYVDEEGGEEFLKDDLFKCAPLPRTINTWYSAYYNSMYISQGLYQSGSASYLKDVTQFMYYFDLLLKRSVDILNNTDDKLSIDIYNIMDGGSMVDAVRTRYRGYYYLAGILTESKNFEEIWISYLELFDLYTTGKLTAEDGKFVIGDNAGKFDAVMADLAALSPAELAGFLSSMNFMYTNNNSILVLSKYEDKGYLNSFALLMNAYYSQVLPEDVYPAFEQLMKAIENFALNGRKEKAIEDFMSAMEAIDAILDGLNTTERLAFNEHFGAIYNKYLEYYTVYTSDEIHLDDETMEWFDALEDAINKIITLSDYITEVGKSEDEDAKILPGTYILLFSLYERADYYYNKIVEFGAENNDIIRVLYTKNYSFGEREFTLERAHYSAGSTYWFYITNIFLTLTNSEGQPKGFSTYDIYISTNLKTYLTIATELLYAQYYNDFTDFNTERLLTSIDAFHGLDRMGVSLNRVFGGHTLHFDGLASYYKILLAEDAAAAALADKLVEASRTYLEYSLSNRDAEIEEQFKAIMVEVIAMREAMGNNTNFDEYISKLYDNYKALYDGILNPDEGGEGDDAPEITPGEDPTIPETPETPENPDVLPEED